LSAGQILTARGSHGTVRIFRPAGAQWGVPVGGAHEERYWLGYTAQSPYGLRYGWREVETIPPDYADILVYDCSQVAADEAETDVLALGGWTDKGSYFPPMLWARPDEEDWQEPWFELAGLLPAPAGRAPDWRKELLSLTPREEAATLFPIGEGAEALERARRDFPEYRLEIEARGPYAAVIVTIGMRVMRWLSA
jgi:hypothetical protein